VELRCPVCRSERLVVILRSQLVLCKVCGWRWLEDEQWERLGLAAATHSNNSTPAPTA
jgi:rubredoxin